MRKMQLNPTNCPVTRAVGFIGGKWKLIILALLVEGVMRFGRLTTFLPTISRKILSQELDQLEEDGLILRHSFNEKPPRVEYQLSEKGKSLIPILLSLREWGIADASGKFEPSNLNTVK